MIPFSICARRFFLKGRVVRLLLVVLLALGLVLGGSGALGLPRSLPGRGAGDVVRPEIRGVWLTNVDSEVLLDRGLLADGVKRLAQLNFNTLYPAVWNWGYTLFPSAVMQGVIGAKIDPRPAGLQDRDPLAELIQQGRPNKLAVIPWFEFGFMVPEDSAIAVRHPDWLTRTQDGKAYWMEGRWSRSWLNPFHPEVQQFLLGLVMEVVDRYEVDGIQFDDHFGLPVEFGYDPVTVKLYQQENGGKLPPIDPQDAQWKRWRADKMSGFLVQVFRAVKARKKQVLISLSPNSYDYAYNRSLQDWRRWQQEGYIEELLPQVYRDSLASFEGELNRPDVQAAKRHIPVAIGVLAGLRSKAVPLARIREQVEAVRRQGLGVSFFFYESLWRLTGEKEGDRLALFRSLFPMPVPRPRV